MGMAAMPAMSLMMTAMSGAAAAYGSYQSGRMTAAAARRNAALARRAAIDARERGGVRESNFRQRVSALVGKQRALVGSSGADVGFGSPVQAFADTEMLGEIDALTIRNNAEREAYGYENAASGFAFEARSARVTGAFGAGATLAGTGGSLYGQYRSFQR